jgi:amidase
VSEGIAEGSIAAQTRWLDATAQADLVDSGQVTAVELVDAAAERIEALDGPVNAVVIRWFDHARDVAASEPTGPFAGVPFLLKDLWAHYDGQVLTNGSIALRNAQPVSNSNSNLVGRFNQAGLVTLGRSSSPELGSVPVTEPAAYGPTRNPWDTTRTSGGSSGGAAVAVATGMVPVAHASDGGGSIRIPASCCGLVGLKPSQGRVSQGPERTEADLGVDFCVTRSVRDTARMLDAVSGPGVGDVIIAPPPIRPFTDELGVDPGTLRIGLLDHHPHGQPVHDDCATAVRAVAALLEGLGHIVEPGCPPAMTDPSFTGRFMALWAVNRATGIDVLSSMAGRELSADDVDAANWAQAQFAKNLTAVDLAKANAAVLGFRRSVHQWWADGHDLLLTPTLGLPPVEIGEIDPQPDDPMAGMRRAAEFVPFTPAFNTSGQPAINLPLHWNDDGMPIGIQLVAAYGREDLLIRVASQLEAAAPWADRTPAG